jgi:hypothetical protein
VRCIFLMVAICNLKALRGLRVVAAAGFLWRWGCHEYGRGERRKVRSGQSITGRARRSTRRRAASALLACAEAEGGGVSLRWAREL